MGFRSHGVMRIPQYLAEIASREVDPAAQPQIETLMPGRSHVDGRRGFGQVVGVRMAGEVVRAMAPQAIHHVRDKRLHAGVSPNHKRRANTAITTTDATMISAEMPG